MNKQAGNKKVIKLAETLASLKQDEIDSFVLLFKERITAKPKFSKKLASDIFSVQPHSRRLTMPLNIYNYKKGIIFNLYAKLFQYIRNTIFMENNNSSK
ncbi:hypothetical protein PBNK65E_000182400 [Plasmodium berghei]|uniref:Uncharacterized protein n=1 Tax=Plasmodium berghei TaxID=5821 RepID=A0A1D3SDS6_PLABE|nr:hypothetical protein PBNK65E_000182400 [Plasmodium berghei]SCO60134.1 hypothetical protein PBSP11RLL_000181500 [Plasmodium berghei]SCO61696.1 hypothetical protein PBSP11A_000181400 [Plasmodium berghei]